MLMNIHRALMKIFRQHYGIDTYIENARCLQKYTSSLHQCFVYVTYGLGGSVAEWLACWTQAQKAVVQIAVSTLLGNSLRQTAHNHCASVHQAAKIGSSPLEGCGG